MDSLLASTTSAEADAIIPAPKIKSNVETRKRPLQRSFDEPLKFLPVIFMLSIILGLWCVYMMLHCLPLMRSATTSTQGWIYCLLFNTLTVLLLSSYVRSILTHPGTIPDASTSSEGASWEIPTDRRLPDILSGQVFQEKKRLGARRDCKWCGVYKPDRCHHCRVCRMCVLKMDHHCPWIYNCVGFHNFKYFFLLITYSCLNLHLVSWTMFSTVHKALRDPGTPFLRMFVLLFGETLAGFISMLLTFFVSFHVYLMFHGMTTIEFCEKSKRRNFVCPNYSKGFLGDIKAVLGDNALLWFLPMSPPSGDGMTFVSEDTPLRYVEEGHDFRRKAHTGGCASSMTPGLADETGNLDVDPMMSGK